MMLKRRLNIILVRNQMAFSVLAQEDLVQGNNQQIF